jgi:hypothetical protein
MSAANTMNPPVGERFPDSHSVSDSSDTSNEEGWEDVEPEEESQPVIGLFSDHEYPDARSMLKECKEKFNFDLLKIQKDLGMSSLRFYVKTFRRGANKFMMLTTCFLQIWTFLIALNWSIMSELK